MFKFNDDALRKGQVGALNTINRLIKEKKVSVVLPTRYGKSDVIRLSFLQLYHLGLVSCAVVTSPADNLRLQIVNKNKIAEMLKRYSVKMPGRQITTLTPKLGGGKGFVLWKNIVETEIRNKQNPCLISTTMQFCWKNGEWLVYWVDYVKHKTGKPPVFFIDECHLGSDDNRTGEFIDDIAAAGALVCVLTATPYREDGAHIPGFGYKRIGEEQINHIVKRIVDLPEEDTKLLIQHYLTTKAIYQVTADYEYTYAQAWAEVPSPLSNIEISKIDVDLSKILNGQFVNNYQLMDMGVSETRKHLGKIVRDPVVMEEVVNEMVFWININRQRKGGEKVKAIVFTGNDSPDDKDVVNSHAKDIKSLIKKVDKSLDVVIATSSIDGSAADRIDAFINKNRGDVLIVKMMASLGIDDPWIKIGVDLSPVRTLSSSIQRMMRIATFNPSCPNAVWITPGDVLSTNIYSMIVSASPGGIKRAEDSSLLDEKIVDIAEGDKPSVIIDGAYLGDMMDIDRNTGRKEYLDLARRFMQKLPEVLGTIGETRIRVAFEETNKVSDEPIVHDPIAEIEKLKRHIHGRKKRIAEGRLKEWRGYGYAGSNDKDFGEAMAYIHEEAIRGAGLPRGFNYQTSINEEAFVAIDEWLKVKEARWLSW